MHFAICEWQQFLPRRHNNYCHYIPTVPKRDKESMSLSE